MDIWINGYYFHSDTEHREALAKLGGLNGTLVRLWFLNCVIWSADVVQYVGYSIRYALVLQREIIGSQFMKPPQPALAMGAIGCGFAAMLVRQ